MAQPGILSWATSIRATMVNDSCRQSLEDQIQMHGFLFLDDYLDNILAQAKRDPIIDLVKTPGRKRDAPKKTRAATAAAKAKSAVTLSLEESDAGKENQPPVNSFHQTLLQSKNNDISRPIDELPHHQFKGRLAETPPSKSSEIKNQEREETTIVEDVEAYDERVVEEILSSPAPPSPVLRPIEENVAESLALPQAEQANDLSVIVEDDESAERSVRLPGAKPVIPNTSQNVITHGTRTVNITAAEHAAMEVDHDTTETSNVLGSSSGQTFHSVALDSPRSQPNTRHNSNANSEYLTAPLPEISEPQSGLVYPTENEAMTGLLPAIPSSASIPNMMTVPIKEQPTQFPSLSAPSPLRKSMRVQREPSFGMGLGPVPPMPSTVNVVLGAGKRTSWLMKAREVKAMEASGKRANALAPAAGAAIAPAPGMSNGLKRKSGENIAIPAPGMAGIMASEEDERKCKIAKTSKGDVAFMRESNDIDKGKEKVWEPTSVPWKPSQLASSIQPEPAQIIFPARSTEADTMLVPIETPQEGMMDRLKRTVEGLGARAGKSMSKSLGGAAAAAALAEARAAKVAAEARIAERDGRIRISLAQENIFAIKQVTSVVGISTDELKIGPVLPSRAQERKLSVSDLVTAYEGDVRSNSKEKVKEMETGFKPARAYAPNQNHAGDESTSTTPPNSPPSTRTSTSSFVLPSGPAFNMPPVFVPPPAVPPKNLSFKMPSTALSLPAISSVDVPVRLPLQSSQKSSSQLSAQSTAASLFSDVAFESQSDGSAWMPNTQDTEYSIATPETRSSQKIGDLDEDDSWPMADEKAAAVNSLWTPFGFAKEDSMTWSTLPTESQRDTRSTQNTTSQSGGSMQDSSAKHVPGTLAMNADEAKDDGLRDDDLDLCESDLGLAAKSITSLATGPERSQSQMSMASTSSSQSQIGWVGQATKLVSSVLGGSKSKKPQVPSLQRAAAAAKKEQEEKDKKATRMKEMENRRQLAVQRQRKAEEEKSKAMEEGKKIKEDGVRRKRERDETTDKRPLKVGTKKVDEDTTKKRKITVEIEKKPIESKKPPSKEKREVAPPRMPPSLGTSTTTKPSTLNKSGGGFKPSGSHPVLSSSATYNAQVTSESMVSVKLAEAKTAKSSTTSTISSIKGKGKAKVQDDGLSQPVHQLQSQMAARAKAQIQAAKQQQAESENIELPDINSEYSDSDDEERPRTFDPPDWAQSPELRQQLHLQSTVNPDDIFGPIRPLKMEEVFRTRQSRFRARTSSANWTGNDRLTVEEEKEYARRMGFR